MKASAPSTRRSSLIIFDVVSLSLRLLVFVLCVIVICDHAGPQKTPGPLSASLVALLSVSLQFARSSHIHACVGSLQCVHSFWHVLAQCSVRIRRACRPSQSDCEAFCMRAPMQGYIAAKSKLCLSSLLVMRTCVRLKKAFCPSPRRHALYMMSKSLKLPDERCGVWEGCLTRSKSPRDGQIHLTSRRGCDVSRDTISRWSSLTWHATPKWG